MDVHEACMMNIGVYLTISAADMGDCCSWRRIMMIVNAAILSFTRVLALEGG